MKLYIYYDYDLILSFISQVLKEDIPIDFITLIRETRYEKGDRNCIEPKKNLEKCNFSYSYSFNGFCANRQEYTFTNLEEVRKIKNNKFIYSCLDKIEEYIFNCCNNNLYHSKKNNKNSVKFLYDDEKFLIKEKVIKDLEVNNKIIYGYLINDTLVKPICMYIKI